MTTTLTTSVAPEPSPTVCSQRRRAELREFLRARRARISPEEAGLAAGPRRRTPGLRREEVAVLAGVGASWYQWLEQGREIGVSPSVLDALSRVLRLNDAERRHLYALAGLNPPLPVTADERPLEPSLRRLLDSWSPRPAAILDRYWNLIAYNESTSLVYGYRHGGINCLVNFFLDERYRVLYEDWERVAAQIVASYRAEMLPYLGDTRFDAIVDQLRRDSAEFAELWSRHEVATAPTLVKTLEHPEAGELRFESMNLRIPSEPGLMLTLNNPLPGTDTEAKVEALLRARRHDGRALQLAAAG